MHAPAALRLREEQGKDKRKKKSMSSWRAGGEANSHLLMHTPAALRLREEGQGSADEVTDLVSGLLSS